MTWKEYKEATERAFVVDALRRNSGNIMATAEEIATPRSNMYKIMERLQIEPERGWLPPRVEPAPPSDIVPLTTALVDINNHAPKHAQLYVLLAAFIKSGRHRTDSLKLPCTPDTLHMRRAAVDSAYPFLRKAGIDLYAQGLRLTTRVSIGKDALYVFVVTEAEARNKQWCPTLLGASQ